MCFHQTQHFGAEVFHAIRPAQTAPGDLAATQVHAFHSRRVNEYLVLGARKGKVRNLGRIQLERDVGLGIAQVGELVEVGTQGCRDHGQEGTQDAVLVLAGNLVQRSPDLIKTMLGHTLALSRAQVGIKARLEQLHHQACNTGIVVDDLFHVRLTERQAGLQQVATVGPHQIRLPPAQAGAEHQLVKTIVVGDVRPHPTECFLEVGADLAQVKGSLAIHDHVEVLDPDFPAIFQYTMIGAFTDDSQSQVFQHGKRIGQGNRIVQATQFESQLVFVERLGTVDAHSQFFRLVDQQTHALHIECALIG